MALVEMKSEPVQWRDDFPIFEQKMSGEPLVYLDTASSAQKPRAVIEAMTNEFPEFVLAVAEDNFLRGYKQGLFDLEWGRKAEKTEKTLKRQFGEKVVDAVMGAIEEGVEDNGGTD